MDEQISDEGYEPSTKVSNEFRVRNIGHYYV